MSFIVGVSEAERAQGSLGSETAKAAYQLLFDQGVVLLRGVFPVEDIDGLYREFVAQLGGIDRAHMQTLSERPPPNPVLEVGKGRYDVSLRMTGAFGRSSLFANPLLINFLGPWLGLGEMRLGNFTGVAAYPGAELQHVHRDHQYLFSEHPDLGPKLPLHAANVSVPLIDIDIPTGPTGLWPGSHRWPAEFEAPAERMVGIPFLRGDCLVMDYRTLHAGMPNLSNRVRPILYLVYCREWFFDDNNHRGRSPLDMPMENYRALPKREQMLLLRGYSYAMRSRILAGTT